MWLQVVTIVVTLCYLPFGIWLSENNVNVNSKEWLQVVKTGDKW
jgi:hypothetical protein